ncbi:hypothetical protein ABFS83_04G184700 [Erythranthe nasuta]
MSSGCSCGSGCKCGDNCSCSMYPDMERNTSVTMIEGVAPVKMYYAEGSEKSFGAEGGNGCKCGSSCTCDPCNC